MGFSGEARGSDFRGVDSPEGYTLDEFFALYGLSGMVYQDAEPVIDEVQSLSDGGAFAAAHSNGYIGGSEQVALMNDADGEVDATRVTPPQEPTA